MTNPSETSQATFLYDGECGICSEWVAYWHKLTGDAVTYRPYQDAAADFPDVPLPDLEQAVHLIEPDGTISRGAEATFKLYNTAPARSLLPWLYARLPGFALLSEYGYRFFSRHRGLLAFITHLFWGRNRQPAQYHFTIWLFLRLLGGIYLSAFISLAVQITGLIGNDGILPLSGYLDALTEHFGARAWWQAPMIFWLYAGDTFLQSVCWVGAGLSLLVIVNRYTAPCLIGLFLLYLSLFHAGQTFMGYQWDLLLLEAGFLAIFLPSGSAIIVWLYRWLLFRFLLLSGIVKILSGDPTWEDLTALNFHFETQPLPTALAWYAHHLPDWILMSATGATLGIELLLPFLIFFPRRFRIGVAWIVIVFQVGILLTGNYNFFNILTIGLCLFLMDDAHIRAGIPGFLAQALKLRRPPPSSKRARVVLTLLAVLIVATGVEQFTHLMDTDRRREPGLLTETLRPLHIVNGYGLFAVMTTLRNEIIIQGTSDGTHWRTYEFKYKPGDPARVPAFNIPHQPRLDWQMWFAALRDPDRLSWFRNFLVRLLENKRPVTRLLEKNPFPERAPLAVRARFYEYHFTTPEEGGSNGNWWKRTLVGEYYPAISLRK